MTKDKARRAEYWRQWYALHREELLARQKETRDPAKAAEQFKRWYAEHGAERNAQKRLQRQANPERERAQQRAAYQRRLEEKRAYAREWQRKEREAKGPAWRFARSANQHARMYGNNQRLDWQKLPMGPCAYCGKDDETVTWDHVIALVRGGANTAANCVRACSSCNHRKHVKTPAEWLNPATAEARKARKREYIRQWHREHRAELREKWRAKHPNAKHRV